MSWLPFLHRKRSRLQGFYLFFAFMKYAIKSWLFNFTFFLNLFLASLTRMFFNLLIKRMWEDDLVVPAFLF